MGYKSETASIGMSKIIKQIRMVRGTRVDGETRADFVNMHMLSTELSSQKINEIHREERDAIR